MKAFVGFPFLFGDAYRAALKAACEQELGEAIFADEVYQSRHIWDNIRDMVWESDVCVFDITGLNPNVLIELGFARGLGEAGGEIDPILVLDVSRHLEMLGIEAAPNIPFPIPEDIAGFQRLQYDSKGGTDFSDLKAKIGRVLGQYRSEIGGAAHYKHIIRQKLAAGPTKFNELYNHAVQNGWDLSEPSFRILINEMRKDNIIKLEGARKAAIWSLV